MGRERQPARSDAREAREAREARDSREPRESRPLGLEARAQADDHLDTRIWLRLLACSTDIEHHIRQRLRRRFGTTLSRFDYMAQLERHPQGLRMNSLSERLMVTGGNVTGLTDQLVADGSVERVEDPQDRRAWLVRLTPDGRRRFKEMAAEHEAWLTELFTRMAKSDKKQLFALLGGLREQLHHHRIPS